MQVAIINAPPHGRTILRAPKQDPIPTSELASRRKGMWMGGWAPLGYEVKDHKLVVNQREAASVRSTFQRFGRVGSMTKLAGALRVRRHDHQGWQADR